MSSPSGVSKGPLESVSCLYGERCLDYSRPWLATENRGVDKALVSSLDGKNGTSDGQVLRVTDVLSSANISRDANVLEAAGEDEE